jgi:hypothetical protein
MKVKEVHRNEAYMFLCFITSGAYVIENIADWGMVKQFNIFFRILL